MNIRNISWFVLLISWVSFAQEKGGSETVSRHSIGINIGHEHIFNGRNEEGEKEVLVLPYYGLDYNYRFSEKFSLGLHTDFIIESFEVEKKLESGASSQTVKRSRPIAPAAMLFYKPGEHWGFGLGAGAEFAKEENYFLTRAATEYEVEFGKGWEFIGALQYDLRWQAYDTWTISLGVAKSFGRKVMKHK